MEEEDNFITSYMQDVGYIATSAKEVAEKQTHLTKKQQQELQELLANFEALFSGKLGEYKGKKLRLNVDTNAVLRHSRPYAATKAHEEIFIQELRHLVDIGISRTIGATQWASPTFI